MILCPSAGLPLINVIQFVSSITILPLINIIQFVSFITILNYYYNKLQLFVIKYSSSRCFSIFCQLPAISNQTLFPRSHITPSVSTDSIPEEEDSDLPPPHPSLLSDYPPLSPLSPPFRKESRGSLPRVVPPPLPPRSRMPPLPPRSSSSQGNSGDFSNIALFESHVYASSQQFVDHNG